MTASAYCRIDRCAALVLPTETAGSASIRQCAFPPMRRTTKIWGAAPRRLFTDGGDDAAETEEAGVHRRVQGGGGGAVPEGRSSHGRGGPLLPAGLDEQGMAAFCGDDSAALHGDGDEGLVTTGSAAS